MISFFAEVGEWVEKGWPARGEVSFEQLAAFVFHLLFWPNTARGMLFPNQGLKLEQ